MLEGHAATVHIGLGEGLADGQRRAVESHRTAAWQRQEPVDQLHRRVIAVGGVQHGVVKRCCCAFQQAYAVAAPCGRYCIARYRSWCRAGINRRGIGNFDAERVDRERAVLGVGVVNTAIAHIGIDAVAAILDGERDAVGARGVGQSHVNQLACRNIGLREGGPCSKRLAVQLEVALGRRGHTGKRVDQVGVARIRVSDFEHGRRDGQARCPGAQGLGQMGRQHRVVVVWVNGEVDRARRRGWRPRAAAVVGDAHIEAVCGGLGAVVAVGQLGDVVDHKTGR